MLNHVILAVISIIFIPICMIGCKYLANTLIMGDDSVDGDSIPVAGNTDRKNIIKKLEVKVSTVKMVILSLNFPHHMFHLLLEYLIS